MSTANPYLAPPMRIVDAVGNDIYSAGASAGGGGTGTNGSAAPTTSSSNGYTNAAGNQTAVSPTTPLPVAQPDALPMPITGTPINATYDASTGIVTTTGSGNIVFDTQGWQSVTMTWHSGGASTGVYSADTVASISVASSNVPTFGISNTGNAQSVLSSTLISSNIVQLFNTGPRFVEVTFNAAVVFKVLGHSQRLNRPDTYSQIATTSVNTVTGLSVNRSVLVPTNTPLAVSPYLYNGSTQNQPIEISNAVPSTAVGVQAVGALGNNPFNDLSAATLAATATSVGTARTPQVWSTSFGVEVSGLVASAGATLSILRGGVQVATITAATAGAVFLSVPIVGTGNLTYSFLNGSTAQTAVTINSSLRSGV